MEKKDNLKLKVAIIGGGLNSSIGLIHISALNSSNDWEITCGIFGKDKNFIPKSLNKSSIKLYNSIKNLIKFENGKIDVFLILTPPGENKKIIDIIKKTKIPIVTEKPAFNSLKGLKNLKEFIDRNNIKFLSTYNYSYFPALYELKYLVNKEKSKLNKIIIEMPQQGFFLNNSKIKKWRKFDKYIPNLFLDLGSHIFNLTFYLTNSYPDKLICKTNTKNKTVVDTNIWAKFKKKFEGVYWISKNAGGHDNSLKIEIFFEKKSFLWELKNPDIIVKNDANGKKILISRSSNNLKYFNKNEINIYKAGHPTGFAETFINLYNDIFRKIQNKKYKIRENDFNFNHCYKIIMILNAMQNSSKKNNWVYTNVK